MQPHSSSTPEKSPFNLLIEDIEVLRDAREIRENARQSSIARQQADAARNRRILSVQRQKYQQHQKRRVLAKAATPAPVPAPDFAAIAAQQALLETAMRESAARAKQNAVRDRLADLAQDAKAGRLDAHSAALFDVYRGQAGAMGLQP